MTRGKIYILNIHTRVTIILKSPTLKKFVANRKFKVPVICHSYIVGVNVDRRLIFFSAHGIVLGPICVWVCEEIHGISCVCATSSYMILTAVVPGRDERKAKEE